MGEYSSTRDVKMPSQSMFQTLAPHRGRYNVRTFWEEDIEIPIYEMPITIEG